MTVWIEPAEVFDMTGIEVSQAEIQRAAVIVELEAGTTVDSYVAGTIASRNAGKIRRAVAMQAVWMLDHPDIYSAMDVSSVSQDGVSAQFRGDWAQYLAPLAKRYLDQLTWKTAPLRVQQRNSIARDRGDRDSAVRDDSRRWDPL